MNLLRFKNALPVLTLLISGTVATARVKHPATGEIPHSMTVRNLEFEENKGQWIQEAKYRVNVPAGAMFITDKGFVYNYANLDDQEKYHHLAEEGKSTEGLIFHHHAYRMNFVGANADIKYTTEQKSTAYHNYFIGNDKSKWASKVGLYGVVHQSNIYNGIDAKIYSKEEMLEYDFTVAPNVDYKKIKLSYEGVNPALTKEGNLRIKTSVNDVTELAPYTYQIINGVEKKIASRYALNKNVVSFEILEDYDHSKPLVIDPVLVFATYSGGTAGPYYAYSTTYDDLGNMYTAALGTSASWPTTLNAYQTTYPGTNCDAINKYNASGSNLVYSTYFGGNGVTQPNAMRVNSLNELVIVGATLATNLGTTVGAYDNTANGSTDFYVARFNVDGTALVGCTYVGGTSTDDATMDIISGPSVQTGLTGSGILGPCELNFDNQNNIWVVGNTTSTDFPVTANAIQSTNGGAYDGVVFKLSADCSQLLYSSYFGGTSNDALYGIEFLSNNNVVVVGGTQSTNITTTTGTLHPTAPGGGWDGYIAVINPNQTALVASTYLGTTAVDNAAKIQIDESDNIYVLGRTMGDYPISTGVYSIAQGDVYIDKITPNLVTSLMSTRVGSSETPTSTSTLIRYLPTAFLLDICQNIYVCGLTPSHAAPTGTLPTTADAFSTVAKPFWFCVLEPNFDGLLFGSFFGIGTGDHPHAGTSRLDPTGIVYHSFCSATNGATSIGTPGSWSPTKLNTTNDNYSFKFNFEATGVNSNFVLDPAVSGNDTGCAPYQVHFLNTSTQAEAYTWTFGDGSSTSNVAEPIHIFNTPGTYTISLHANNDSSCITDDTAYLTITVMQVNPPDFDVHDTLLCSYYQNIDIGLTLNNPSIYNTIQWGPLAGITSANNTPTITVDPTVNNVYYVTVKDTIPGICGFSATDTVHIDLSPRVLDIINNDSVVCEGAVVPINAVGSAGYTYIWSPSTGVSDSTALTPSITINQPNFYTLTASYPNCPDTSVTLNIGMHYIPHLTVSPDKYVCQGTDVNLESSVTPYRNDYIYSWTPATPNLTTPNGPNTHFVADTTITYYLNIQTPIGCADDDTVMVTVYPIGFGSISPDTGYCSGTEGSVTLQANGGTSYSWSPAYGLSSTAVANPVANPPTSTEYTVIITNAHNCLDTEKVKVDVFPAAMLTMPDSMNIYSGESYQVEPGTNCLYFSWFPPSGLDATTISNPSMSPQVRTRYFVNATTEHGCAVTDSIDIIVKETVIDMPNAFKPGGANGTFKPSKRGIAQLIAFEVYNRWGNKVFSTTNIEQGWDGTYNDKAQPLGVYVYKIDAISDSGKRFTKQGTVTLVR